MSFLLLVLIGMGLVMGSKTMEHFDSPSVAVSPALANIIKTPAIITSTTGTINVDSLKRDVDVVAAKGETVEHKCPKCEVCPDMTQYVRLDEVPCWNCSLP
jgi:hypothetical protein